MEQCNITLCLPAGFWALCLSHHFWVDGSLFVCDVTWESFYNNYWGNIPLIVVICALWYCPGELMMTFFSFARANGPRVVDSLQMNQRSFSHAARTKSSFGNVLHFSNSSQKVIHYSMNYSIVYTLMANVFLLKVTTPNSTQNLRFLLKAMKCCTRQAWHHQEVFQHFCRQAESIDSSFRR